MLTSRHAEDLEDMSMEVWGMARKVGRRVGRRSGSPSPMQPIGTARGLWVRLQVSVKHATSEQYTHMKEWALKLLCSPGQGFQV